MTFTIRTHIPPPTPKHTAEVTLLCCCLRRRRLRWRIGEQHARQRLTLEASSQTAMLLLDRLLELLLHNLLFLAGWIDGGHK